MQRNMPALDSSPTPVMTGDPIELKMLDSQASKEAELSNSSSGLDPETARKLKKLNAQTVAAAKSQRGKKTDQPESSPKSSSGTESHKKPAAKPMARANQPNKLFDNDDPDDDSSDGDNANDADALLASVGNVGKNNDLFTILKETKSHLSPPLDWNPFFMRHLQLMALGQGATLILTTRNPNQPQSHGCQRKCQLPPRLPMMSLHPPQHQTEPSPS